MSKIFWTRDEERIIGEEAARLITLEREQGRVPIKREIAERSMLALPKERRRPMHANVILAISKLGVEHARKREDEKMPDPVLLQPASAADQIEALAETIGNAFGELFAAALRLSLDRTKELVQHPSTPSRTALPKVTIIGLLPKQANEIKHDFHSAYNLRFWKDESPHTLKSLVKSSDAVVIMKDFVAHGHIDLVHSAGGADRVRLLSGTTTRLREYLGQLFEKH